MRKQKPGAPTDEHWRTVRVTVRFTRVEHAELAKLAAAGDVELARLVRRAALALLLPKSAGAR